MSDSIHDMFDGAVQHFISLGAEADVEAVVVCCQQLIAHYDNPFADRVVRTSAAAAASRLASAFEEAARCLLEDARKYAAHQTIDDSWPYEPNSVTILRDIGRTPDAGADSRENRDTRRS